MNKVSKLKTKSKKHNMYKTKKEFCAHRRVIPKKYMCRQTMLVECYVINNYSK